MEHGDLSIGSHSGGGAIEFGNSGGGAVELIEADDTQNQSEINPFVVL